mgnify:CR=1 FL=1
MGLARRLRRGRAKIIRLSHSGRFLQYERTNRGKWRLKDNLSAPLLTEGEMQSLINSN